MALELVVLVVVAAEVCDFSDSVEAGEAPGM